MSPRYLCLLLLAIFVTACNRVNFLATAEAHASDAVQPAIPIQDIVIAPGDFQDANSNDLALLPEGLAPTTDAIEGNYQSEPLQAPLKFNAVVPHWKIDLPENSEMHLELRTGNDPSDMGHWIHIQPALDWMEPDDEEIVGDMLVVPADDVRHEYVQYRISLVSNELQEGPLLREMRLTFIDSSAGLSVDEMIARQQEIDRSSLQAERLTVDGYPKPFVISREVWCTDPACNYTDGLSYHTVTHLILHHTVSGAGGDSAATVRAIWAYHTSSRGWRDIGYNFLVDTEGVIFEGHLGGDDVVGIHASGANAGTMALAMIGTYSTTVPPQPMFESAVDLFSWKADQRNIDVFDASDVLPGIDWGLPHLMGHRDVYGTTECPGGAAHALIPNMRDEVASRIGLESPHIYVDELSNQFIKSDANWYDGPLQCGHNAHSWYTWSTTSQEASANWGEWRPAVPASGRYRIEVYAPYCNTGRSETTGAKYTVEHADGSTAVIVNQDDRIGLWTSLGEYNFLAGNSNVIRLTDLTTTDSGRGMWFDAIRLRSLEVLPSAFLEQPADDRLLADRNVAFSWRIENQDKVEATILQVATDREFTHRIVNLIWPSPVLSADVTFDDDYADLYWRVVVSTHSGAEFPSTARHFSIDTIPPVSRVSHLLFIKHPGYYQLFWQGQDALSGVASFNIDYRIKDTGDAIWVPWQTNTSVTSAIFKPYDPSMSYEFRSHATDQAGNEEIARPAADISTDEAIVLGHAVYLPLVGADKFTR